MKEDKRVYTKKGAEEILSFAKERGIHTIVASSNTRVKVEMYLKWKIYMPCLIKSFQGMM